MYLLQIVGIVVYSLHFKMAVYLLMEDPERTGDQLLPGERGAHEREQGPPVLSGNQPDRDVFAGVRIVWNRVFVDFTVYRDDHDSLLSRYERWTRREGSI